MHRSIESKAHRAAHWRALLVIFLVSLPSSAILFEAWMDAVSLYGFSEKTVEDHVGHRPHLIYPNASQLNPVWYDSAFSLFYELKIKSILAVAVVFPVFLFSYIALGKQLKQFLFHFAITSKSRHLRYSLLLGVFMIVLALTSAILDPGQRRMSSCKEDDFSFCMFKQALLVLFGVWSAGIFFCAAISIRARQERGLV